MMHSFGLLSLLILRIDKLLQFVYNGDAGQPNINFQFAPLRFAGVGFLLPPDINYYNRKSSEVNKNIQKKTRFDDFHKRGGDVL
jgi:hypothetical protein